MVTLAPGTMPPLVSLTVPERVPVISCAGRAQTHTKRKTTKEANILRRTRISLKRNRNLTPGTVRRLGEPSQWKRVGIPNTTPAREQRWTPAYPWMAPRAPACPVRIIALLNRVNNQTRGSVKRKFSIILSAPLCLVDCPAPLAEQKTLNKNG